MDLGRVFLDGGEFRPLKLSQILCVTIEELKRKVDLGEAVIDEVEDKPQKIGIESKLSFPNPFDDLSFFLVVRGHVRGIGRDGRRVQRRGGKISKLPFLR